jgi:hypothetical protein
VAAGGGSPGRAAPRAARCATPHHDSVHGGLGTKGSSGKHSSSAVPDSHSEIIVPPTAVSIKPKGTAPPISS